MTKQLLLNRVKMVDKVPKEHQEFQDPKDHKELLGQRVK